RRNARYSHGRYRPCVSASRERNRAKRSRDRQTIFAVLAARRTSARRRRKDVQVGRQFLYIARPLRQRTQTLFVALRALQRSVSPPVEFYVWRFAASRKFGRAPPHFRGPPQAGKISRRQ